ncbi:MAG: phosphatase PAP2 family protein [Vicinamibacterales bacterium]
MHAWVAASVSFFVYVAVVSLFLRDMPRRRRGLAIGGAATGLLVSAAAHLLPHHAFLHGWILPPVTLVLAYWTSGLLYIAPMPRAERALEAVDAFLGIDDVAAAAPRWLAELLEVAYASIYPLIPVALVVYLLTDSTAHADRFWTVILVTDFICFGFLPWVQTLPPRARRVNDPWVATVRRVNLTLLGNTSIQANTFPSGHAGEAVAVALLVANAPWMVAAWMGCHAVLISAGAVLGRYHYAADAVAGWAVAFCVWALVVSFSGTLP